MSDYCSQSNVVITADAIPPFRTQSSHPAPPPLLKGFVTPKPPLRELKMKRCPNQPHIYRIVVIKEIRNTKKRVATMAIEGERFVERYILFKRTVRNVQNLGIHEPISRITKC